MELQQLVLKCCRFIQDTAHELRLPTSTVFTAAEYAHRWFHHLQDPDGTGILHQYCWQKVSYHDVAAASLFLAVKVTESPRKPMDIAMKLHKVATQRANPSDSAPQPSINTSHGIEECRRWLEMMVRMEDRLIEVLGFQLWVDLPYGHLEATVQQLNLFTVDLQRNPETIKLHASQAFPDGLIILSKCIGKMVQESSGARQLLIRLAWLFISDLQKSTVVYERLFANQQIQNPAREMALCCTLFALRAFLLVYFKPDERATFDQHFCHPDILLSETPAPRLTPSFVQLFLESLKDGSSLQETDVYEVWKALDLIYINCGFYRPLDGLLQDVNGVDAGGKHALANAVWLEGRYYLNTVCFQGLREVLKGQNHVLGGLPSKQHRNLSVFLSKWSVPSPMSAQDQVNGLIKKEQEESKVFYNHVQKLEKTMEDSLMGRFQSRMNVDSPQTHHDPSIPSKPISSSASLTSSSRVSVSSSIDAMHATDSWNATNSSVHPPNKDGDEDLEDGELFE